MGIHGNQQKSLPSRAARPIGIASAHGKNLDDFTLGHIMVCNISVHIPYIGHQARAHSIP